MTDVQKKLNILLIEDDEKDAFLIEKNLSNTLIDSHILIVQTLKQAFKIIDGSVFDIILLDLSLPDSKGLNTINKLIEKTPNIPIIVLTGLEDRKTVLDAVTSGVEDYIFKKSITSDLLVKSIYYSIERKKNELELIRYKNHLEEIVEERTDELKKANNQLKENLGLMEKLVEFGRKINNSLNLENIVLVVKEMLKDILYADFCSIFLLDIANNKLSLLAHNHPIWDNKDSSADYNKKNGIMWDSINNKKTIMVKKFSESPYASKEQRIKYKHDAAICIPLMVEKTIIGVMNLSNILPSFLTDENLAKINTIAQHLSLAMNNSLLHRQVEKQSIIDDLSGLYNRRYLYSILEYEMLREKRHDQGLSIIMIDIDFFKKVNDSYGHNAGDIAIKKISKNINDNVRKIDIPCRYGGEEFIVILPFTSEKGAKIVAERIRKSIEKDVIEINESIKLSLTISIGIAKYENGESIDSLINRSDKALYSAKQKGRNRSAVLQEE